MTKPETAKSFSLLGIVLIVAGGLILILAILNYIQDRRISLTAPMGLASISFGLLLYSHGKKQKQQ